MEAERSGSGKQLVGAEDWRKVSIHLAAPGSTGGPQPPTSAMITACRTPQTNRYRLHHDQATPAAARRITRTTLTDWGWHPDSIDSAVLIVSELVTNAVEYALPPIALYIASTPRPADPPSLRVKVTDGGPDPAAQAHHDNREPEEHGRGIPLIHGLTCGTDADAPGNRWVRVCAVTGAPHGE